MIDNIGLYRMFFEVAKSGSISEAAQKLYVTQPAVSAAVKQLEAALGTCLFFRTNRGIKLTPEGELLLTYVRSAFNSIEAGEDKLREISGLSGGILRIGASDMTLRFYLLDYIQRFNIKYPKVRLSISNAPTPKTLDALLAGNIEFGVVSEPVDLPSDVVSYPVKTVRDVVVCSSDKYDGRVVSYEEISSQTLIMLERGTSSRKYIETQLKENGAPEFMLEPDIELATSDLLIDFAKRGIGLSFVNEEFAREDIQRGNLREVKLEKPFKKRNFLLIHLKKIPLSAAAKHFVEMIEEKK